MNNAQEKHSPATSALVLLVHECKAALKNLRAAVDEFSSVQEVLEANNASQALRLLLGRRPNLIIVSLNLPDNGGFELLRCIKQAYADCLVYLVCNCKDGFIREAGMLLGATGVCCILDGMEELRSELKPVLAAAGN